MQINIEGLVKPVEKNGKVITHRDTSFSGVSHYHCSTFIKKKNVLVKGEWNNGYGKKRNAMILLFDCESGNFIGKSNMKIAD